MKWRSSRDSESGNLKTIQCHRCGNCSHCRAPGRIDSVSLWGIFVEQADGHYRVRLRSKIHPINEIAKEHDGGGHPLASGANSYSLEENEIIYQKLKNLLKN